LHLEPAALAILAQADTAAGRAACDRRNRCSSGCPGGAKSSYDFALLDPVLASHPGRLQVITRALAIRLLPQAGRPERIAAVEYVDLSQLAPAADSPERLEADVFVVAGGPVETPRLLMLSACRAHPDGIGNAEGQVGRYACESLHLALALLFNEPLASHLGPSMESVAEVRVGERPGLVTVTQEALALVRPWDYAQRVTESWWGAGRLREIAASYGHAVGLLGECAQAPAASNRISLDPGLKDPLGRPSARLTSAHSAGDLEQLAALREKVQQLAAETKARVVEQFSVYDAPPGGAELHCSCRMHADPRQGVVDAQQRVHGMENLYICDASALPAPGPANPSLTTAALGFRLAEHLDGRKG